MSTTGQPVIPPHKRYVTEVVWLPTYVCVFLFSASAGAGAIGIFLALVVSRAVLEFIYRLAFGEERHELRTKVIAFVMQLFLWGLLLAWYASA